MIDIIAYKQGQYRKRRLRSKKHLKTSDERPRMVVTKTNKALYVNVIDDVKHTVLCSYSTRAKELGEKKLGKNIEAAKQVGAAIGKKLKALKIEKIAFDRNGYPYHGKIKALAEACREAGIQF
ncbi:MAG: 50S ribosomal protein L18 [Spirochaetes bacterium GWF1_51_8]|nr:MAG: 50S ribosomal protein L18 [Spirochaetes bacterium GWF1_51_8]